MRLEELGWLASRWAEDTPEGRPRRRLYHLTATGLAGASALLEERRGRPAGTPRRQLRPAPEVPSRACRGNSCSGGARRCFAAEPLRERFEEEWLADLDEVPRRLAKLAHVPGVLLFTVVPLLAMSRHGGRRRALAALLSFRVTLGQEARAAYPGPGGSRAGGSGQGISGDWTSPGPPCHCFPGGMSAVPARVRARGSTTWSKTCSVTPFARAACLRVRLWSMA